MFIPNDDDGSITIDFPLTGTNGESSSQKIVVAPPPTVGAYKRVRGFVEQINKKRDDLAKELRENDDVGAAEMQHKLGAYTEDSALEWWKFVLVGDDTYRGQASEPPPDDTDDWPVYLTSNEAITLALTHWKKVPSPSGV